MGLSLKSKLEIFIYIIYAIFESFVKFFIPISQKELDGEIILITGSGQGIGRALCIEIAKLAPKAKLVCWDYSQETNEKVVKNLRQMGISAFAYKVDISDENQVKINAERVKKEVGVVTILINNAGVGFSGEFLHTSTEQLMKVFNVNLFSHFYTIKEFLPGMIEKGRGHIAATASLSAEEAFPFGVPYCSSKFAVNGYMDTLRKEMLLHPYKPDIKFTTIFPYFVSTQMLIDRVDETKFEPGMVTPEYVAKCYIEGIRKNKMKVYAPPSSIFVIKIGRLLPTKVSDFLIEIFQAGIIPKNTDTIMTGHLK